MKRLDSRKSHSWWWDSHVSPKNNKWLAENLEEMDRGVKRMLKLIEEEGDSFAKKAEMYYQKRPELISQVENFYRMYRSLAERYDNLTGEIRKNISATDLQTQGSGVSDAGSESASPLNTPDRRPSRRRSSHRAAGFDVFLGSAGSSDVSRKTSDESSLSASGSESESDEASSKNNYLASPENGDSGLRRRIIDLEVELRDMEEKYNCANEMNAVSRSNHDQLLGRITLYDEELKVTKAKLQCSEEEIARLKSEFEKAESLEMTRYLHTQLESAEKDIEVRDDELKLEKSRVLRLQERVAELVANVTDSANKIEALNKELTFTNKKLEASDNEIARLRLLFESNESSVATPDSQVEFVSALTPDSQVEFGSAIENFENPETDLEPETSHTEGLDISDPDSKIKSMEEELRIRYDKLRFSEVEIARLKHELEKNHAASEATIRNLQVQLESCQNDIDLREAELQMEKAQVKELQDQVVQLEGLVSSRDHEIVELKVVISNAEQNLVLEKSHLQDQIVHLEGEVSCRSDEIGELKVAISSAEQKLLLEKSQLQDRIVHLEGEVSNSRHEIEELEVAISNAEQKHDAEKSQLETVISGLSESRAVVEEKLKEWEVKGQALEEDIRRGEAERAELQETRLVGLQNEVERLKADIVERSNQVEETNKRLDALKLRYDALAVERDELKARLGSLASEVGSKDKQMHEMEEHLHRLHIEHVGLIAGCEGAQRVAEELRGRLKEAEKEVERQRGVIWDGAEEKREAIRQLCFSLEHYRNNYHRLKKALVVVHKRQAPILLAS